MTEKSKRHSTASRRKGFTQTGALVATGIRSVAEKRGFAQTRMLTHWAEVAGPEVAAIATPVKVSYRQEGLGATLTLACAGSRAPELSLQLEVIRERVNACYGYNAISRIRLTHDAALAPSPGLAEAPAPFRPAPKPVPEVAGIRDGGLRDALEQLSTNLQSRAKPAASKES
ncbi:DUF721 domain-containing protein [Halovulum sp. GXIMD14793]